MNANPKLLVVDDEATIRNFLVRVLEREGYQVIAASNGAEALTLLETHPVDLILSDIRMDQLDGVGLLKQARQQYPDTAILLLTGHATVDSAVAALQHGALNYLLKPVKNEEIVEAVKAGLATRANQLRRDKLEQMAAQMAAQFSSVLLGDVVPPMPAQDSIPTPQEIICGALKVDLAGYTAYKDDERLNLTPTEFRLLVKFIETPGAVFDYVELVRDACGYSCARHEAQEIINAHVRNLRGKLDIEAGAPLYIESIRGIGYRIMEPAD